ncbi:MAG: hypothetical protein KAJ19_15350, partial [Gammaproteobacteria bacterium]|nr:hypothetical protein [Gammaproteobacteria bacterium]
VSGGKPRFVSDDGIEIEHIPTHKGVAINIIVNGPSTAPFEYSFSIKTYGQDYTYIQQEEAIVAMGNDLKSVTIRATNAVDADGNESPISLILSEVVGGFQTFKKVVDESWLRSAIAPVKI